MSKRSRHRRRCRRSKSGSPRQEFVPPFPAGNNANSLQIHGGDTNEQLPPSLLNTTTPEAKESVDSLPQMSSSCGGSSSEEVCPQKKSGEEEDAKRGLAAVAPPTTKLNVRGPHNTKRKRRRNSKPENADDFSHRGDEREKMMQQQPGIQKLQQSPVGLVVPLQIQKPVSSSSPSVIKHHVGKKCLIPSKVGAHVVGWMLHYLRQLYVDRMISFRLKPHTSHKKR